MLKNIGVRNFRSFNDEGIFLDKLSKVNIIVGKNNSGKSNILRFLKRLSDDLNDLHKLGNLSVRDSYTQGAPVSLGFRFSHEELNWPSTIKKNIYTNENSQLSDVVKNPFEVWLPFKNERISKDLLPQDLLDLDITALGSFFKKQGSYSKDSILNDISANIDNLFQNRLKSIAGLISIPDLRVISPSSNHNSGNSEINGKNIIEEMFQMQHPNPGDEHRRELFDKIERLLQSLLNTKELTLEIPYGKDDIIVKMHGKRLPLGNYGSGIYQIVLLCSSIIVYEEKVICIEEPETHLHPELQRKLLDFIEKETTNTYFITTHSNVFINYSKGVSIYHIKHDGFSSSLTRIENSSSSHKLLDDLGYKSSDIIQANGIIWVEGPSDRNYILKWISLLDDRLEEGLHFSIMFYGGKNLANVAFTDVHDEELLTTLIPLLKINRNAAVVIDSDITETRKEINETKKRIQAEVGEDHCWITKGKEIENYITLNVIKKWLTEKNLYNNEVIDMSASLFKDIVASADKTAKIDYDSRKTKYSNEIGKHFILEDLEFRGLKIEVQRLIGLIKNWNHQQ